MRENSDTELYVICDMISCSVFKGLYFTRALWMHTHIQILHTKTKQPPLDNKIYIIQNLNNYKVISLYIERCSKITPRYQDLSQNLGSCFTRAH